MARIRQAPATAILSIAIDKLFGRYSYAIPSPDAPHPHSRLLLLYGDNGCGKTTLLKLVFHLLSPSNNRGHRNFVARVPFRRLSVHLASGVHIHAQRIAPVVGNYRLTLLHNDNILVDFEFVQDGPTQVELSAFLKQLTELELALYFLGDDRRIESDAFPEPEEQFGVDTPLLARVQRALHPENERPRTQRDADLESAIHRAVAWLRQKTLRAASIGEANTNSLYETIVKRIAELPAASDPLPQMTATELITLLEGIEARNEEFVRLGLLPPFHARNLIHAILAAPETSRPIITQVLLPYVNGLSARLDALKDVHSLLKRFSQNLRGFFKDKRVTLTPQEGLLIRAHKRSPLEPHQLSSGEKQLLLLLCNALGTRDSAAIFIIDEPELSLNVKWQRKLIGALLDCTQGSRTQFLIATHSIELIAQHSADLVKLTPIEGQDELE